MTSTIILTVYMGLFILEFLIDWTLDILNLNASLKNGDDIPQAFTGRLAPESFSRSTQYTRRRGRFGLVTSLWSRVLIIAILATGAIGLLDSLVISWNLPAYLHGLVFILLTSAAMSLASWPLSLYSRFVIEEEFGFNRMTLKTLLADSAKETAVGVILIAALLGGLYAALALTGSLWWLAAWGFWALFQLLMVVLYPLVIAPLFNRFEPLPEGSLKDRLSSLADRAGFANRGIFVMDGSRRSSHSNAYFTGIGASRRIVIYDTLVESLEEEELEAVLAHEIGHWKHGHIRRSLIIGMAVSLVLFAIMGFLLEWTPLYAAFGIGGASLHGLLAWLLIFPSPVTGLFSPLGNRRSRKHEYQADAYAVEMIGGGEAMKNALICLSRDNLSNLTPHPAYSAWHYSHPAPIERLRAIDGLVNETVTDL